MLSGLMKYILVATSMAPVLLTFYGINAMEDNCWKSGLIFLISAIVLLYACLLLLNLSKKKLEVLDINITSVSKSKDFLPFPLNVVSGKIIIPEEKKECRIFLEFLNEQIYKGIFSGKVKRTNSSMDLNPSEQQ